MKDYPTGSADVAVPLIRASQQLRAWKKGGGGWGELPLLEMTAIAKTFKQFHDKAERERLEVPSVFLWPFPTNINERIASICDTHLGST